jgi:hypothetical protein
MAGPFYVLACSGKPENPLQRSAIPASRGEVCSRAKNAQHAASAVNNGSGDLSQVSLNMMCPDGVRWSSSARPTDEFD